MTIVAVIGDAQTTLAAAIVSAWPAGETAVLVEANRAGGVLAGWFGVAEAPGLGSAIAAAPTGSWPMIEANIQTTPPGVRLLASPVRSVEAIAVVADASSRLVPTMAALAEPTFVVDPGVQHPTGLSPFVTAASVVVVGVRQPVGGAAGVAAHLEQIGELVDAVAGRDLPVVLAVIGGRPYPVEEVAGFIIPAGHDVAVCPLPVDDYAAAVLAGHPGNGRRFARSPLTKGIAAVVAEIRVRTTNPSPTRMGVGL